MELRVARGDPAGNITAFVLDPVAPEERTRVARALLALPCLDAEQVAFVCPPKGGADGRIEMSGGEFCGNAVRAYGLLLARERGAARSMELTLEISGCDDPVTVDVHPGEGFVRASMPLPRSVRPLARGALEGTVVDLGGIVHFVTHCPPDEGVLEDVEPLLLAPREAGGYSGAEAYGVIFLHGGRMTPLVKVPAAGSLCWEGSCGSGTLAAGAAESRAVPDGVFSRDYFQPAGVIRLELARKGGRIVSAAIGGPVTLDEPITVDV